MAIFKQQNGQRSASNNMTKTTLMMMMGESSMQYAGDMFTCAETCKEDALGSRLLLGGLHENKGNWERKLSSLRKEHFFKNSQ